MVPFAACQALHLFESFYLRTGAVVERHVRLITVNTFLLVLMTFFHFSFQQTGMPVKQL
jgi:hypothetical protein